MNSFFQDRLSRSTAGTLIVTLSAAMATGQAHWPDREVPMYVVPQTAGTYSSFVDRAVIFAPKFTSDVFAREIAQVYAALSADQEPLGAEFEAIWDANVDSLYEA